MVPPEDHERPATTPDPELAQAVNSAVDDGYTRLVKATAHARMASTWADQEARRTKSDRLAREHPVTLELAQKLLGVLEGAPDDCFHAIELGAASTRPPGICLWTPPLKFIGCLRCVSLRFDYLRLTIDRACDSCGRWAVTPLGTMTALGPVVLVAWLCSRCRRPHRRAATDVVDLAEEQLNDALLEHVVDGGGR